MPQSTPEECARLELLDGEEDTVLFFIAYGYGNDRAARELHAMKRSSSRSFAEVLASVHAKMGVAGLPDSQKFRVAGKIYLDAAELKRMAARVESGDSHPHIV